MKKNTKTITLIIVCIMAVLCFFSAITLTQKSTFAQSITFENAEILSYYNLNEQKNFPESVTVQYDGEQTATDGVIVFPNGYVYAIDGQTITLNQQGEYSLKYFFDYNGRRVTAVKKFNVRPALYSLSAENGSSITAVNEEMSKVDMLSSDDNAMAKSASGQDTQGLIVRLYEGCEFVYNKPVDLRNCEEDGLTNVITLNPRTSLVSRESTDKGFSIVENVASNTYVRFADAYDPSVYVELTFDAVSSPGGNLICYRAGTNTQEPAGITLPSTSASDAYRKEVYYDGVRGVARFRDWGPYGLTYRITDQTTNGVTVRYDYANSKLYVAGAKNQLFVNDFMNSDIYGEIAFDGFTTGEVIVSVRCDGYYVAKASRIDVMSIGQDSGADLVGAISGQVDKAPDYIDDVAPAIKVDVEKTDAYGLFAVVGDDFVIPTATVYDVNDSGKLSVNVYRNYYSQQKNSVAVVDGKFNVDKDDVYYIEYKSVDLYGNTGVEVVKVYAVTGMEKSLSVSADKITGLLAGQKITLPLPTVQTVNNPLKLNLKVVVTQENMGEQVIATANGIDQIEALIDSDLEYTPLYSGSYTIEYICNDNAYSTVFAYSVECQASNVVAFLEKPFINRYLIKDAVYAIEEIKASTFTTGKPMDKDAEAYISFDGNEFKKIDDLNSVKIEGESTACVKFVCDGVEVLSDLVKIVDVRQDTNRAFGGYNVSMSKYFVYDENDFVIDQFDQDNVARTEVIYNSQKTSGNNQLHFVNVLAYQSFSFGFKIAENTSNYEKLNVILTDVYNAKNKVVLTYEAVGDVAYVRVNGGLKSVLAGTFASGEGRRVFYDNNRKQFNFAGVTLSTEIPFTGFGCYLDIELVGINGNAGIEVVNVNNQNFNATYPVDNINPEVSIVKSFGYYNLGDIVTIYHAEYFDVLSPINKTTAKIKVSVDGVVVSATDGTLLDGVSNDAFKDYQVECRQLGSYKIDFSAKDTAGKTISDTYIFKVIDNVAPEIKIKQNYTENAVVKVKAGTKFNFQYTVSDDITDSKDIVSRVVVVNLNTYVSTAYEKGEFYVNQKGQFLVNVICQDQAGNVAMTSFKILAE